MRRFLPIPPLILLNSRHSTDTAKALPNGSILIPDPYHLRSTMRRISGTCRVSGEVETNQDGNTGKSINVGFRKRLGVHGERSKFSSLVLNSYLPATCLLTRPSFSNTLHINIKSSPATICSHEASTPSMPRRGRLSSEWWLPQSPSIHLSSSLPGTTYPPFIISHCMPDSEGIKSLCTDVCPP
jgi:hypothetical protein